MDESWIDKSLNIIYTCQICALRKVQHQAIGKIKIKIKMRYFYTTNTMVKI